MKLTKLEAALKGLREEISFATHHHDEAAGVRVD
jgi:hypothetical protein